jgi:putative flippase GtrA
MRRNIAQSFDGMKRLVFPRFLVVGSLGTVTNLAIFFVTVDVAGWNPTAGATLAFIVAVGQNYVLNHYWTFSHVMKQMAVSFRGYARFMAVACVALCVNLALLWAVILGFDPPWKVIAQAVGILGGTVVNFLGSKYWVFKAHA